MSFLSAILIFIASRTSSLGAETFKRYKHLVGTHTLPFIRASGSKRVILSAQNWTKGGMLFHIPQAVKAYSQMSGFSSASEVLYQPTVDLIIPEAVGPSIGHLSTGS